MLTALACGLPLLALAALIPGYLAFTALLHRFPRIESAIEKAAAFDVFRLL